MIGRTIIILIKNDIFKNSGISGRMLLAFDLKKLSKKEKIFALRQVQPHKSTQAPRLFDVFSLKTKYVHKNYQLVETSNKKQSP